MQVILCSFTFKQKIKIQMLLLPIFKDNSTFSIQLLRDKFREFARETGMVGQERVDMVNQTIDELIEAGHSEAATMAEWKDGINESWADLLELIDTRTQLLMASYELLK